jgi:acetyl-CoA C-acetyltransferase
MAAPDELILRERRGGVLVLTINRPEVRNAFDFATAGAMSAAIDDFEADDGLRAVVVTCAGGTFCAGMDLKAFARGDVPYVERRGVFGVINEPPAKPLIAAVEGNVLAGGFELMLACDLVVAADDASFGIPEVKRGLIAASGGLIELERRLPVAVAMELALTGDPIGAERARDLGLVNELCPAGETLERSVALAERVTRNAPLAVAASKRIRREARDWSSGEAFGKQGEIAGPVLVSEDAQEGARAFAERRDPDWKGR